jgi:SET domain-containing protein
MLDLHPPIQTQVQTTYLHPKAVVRYIAESDFYGVFAQEPIHQGELLTLALGQLVHISQLPRYLQNPAVHLYQIEEEFFIGPLDLDTPPGDPFYVNHSCEPNAVFHGAVALIARRDIVAGEQITIDYATCDGSPYDEFECQCGSALCRGRITGEDWRRPELWERYAGHFSPYLQRRIDRLRNGA